MQVSNDLAGKVPLEPVTSRVARSVMLKLIPITLVSHAVVTFGLKAILIAKFTGDNGEDSAWDRNRENFCVDDLLRAFSSVGSVRFIMRRPLRSARRPSRHGSGSWRPENKQMLQNCRQNCHANFDQVLERAKGIEPSYAAWETLTRLYDFRCYFSYLDRL